MIADRAQRKGVGTALLGRLLVDARDAGLRRAVAAAAPAYDGIPCFSPRSHP